jgi:sugar phosphate isomerase/epimerase
MKNILACATQSYGKFSLERALQGIAGAGLEYVELAAIAGHVEHIKPEEMGAKDVEALKELLKQNGLTAVSISGHCDLPSAEGARLFKARLELARQLGIKVVNTAAGKIETPEDEENFLENIRALADFAAEYGIVIALETHGGILGTAKQCRETLEWVGKSNVLINYDPANLVFYEGLPPEPDIAEITDKIGHFHIKDKIGGKGEWDFPAIGTGTLDFAEMFGVLRKSGYNGIMSFELEFTPEGPPTAEDADEALRQSIAFVMPLLEKA